MRQGGISSEILFNFYLNEVISDTSKLPAGCTLIFSEFNIIGYSDELVRVAPTTQALQFALTSKGCTLWDVYTLSHQINMQK